MSLEHRSGGILNNLYPHFGVLEDNKSFTNKAFNMDSTIRKSREAPRLLRKHFE